MVFNITFEQLNGQAILAIYSNMQSKISSLNFGGLKSSINDYVSFPEISSFFRVTVDWEIKKISGLPRGVEKHWMYLVQTEDENWFLCVYIDYFNAYCYQYGIINQAEKDYLLLRCLIHEFWHYNIPTCPVVFDNHSRRDAVFHLSEEQLLAEVEDELFCMTVIFGGKDCFCKKMKEYEYNFDKYIKNDLKNNSVTCKEVMQYLSFCEQQKWHYVEYSFRYENDKPCFSLRDLNTLTDCFFPTLPPYNVYSSRVIEDFSVPDKLVNQKTQFAYVFREDGNFFSKGQSQFDGIPFFCVVNKQEEKKEIENEKKKVTIKKIVALGHKR